MQESRAQTTVRVCRYDALCKNEFEGLEIEPESLKESITGFRNGEQVLRARGFRGTVSGSILQQVRSLGRHDVVALNRTCIHGIMRG
jgi:hypothetical protein